MGGYSTQFGTDLLNMLGAPATDENLRYLAAWSQAEGGDASFNPFNTTEAYSGATNYNSVGVKNYPSYQAGLEATYRTLVDGAQSDGYQRIIDALRRGDSAMSVAQAEASTPWGTGTLIEQVLGGKVNDVPATSSGNGTVASDGTTDFDAVFSNAVFAEASGQPPDPTVINAGLLGTLTGGLADDVPGLKQLDDWGTSKVKAGAKSIAKSSAEAFYTAFQPILQPVADVFKALEEIFHIVFWLLRPTNDMRVMIFIVGLLLMGFGLKSVVSA